MVLKARNWELDVIKILMIKCKTMMNIREPIDPEEIKESLNGDEERHFISEDKKE